MSATETRQAIESILMVADNPVDPTVLAQLLEVPKADVEAMCDELAAEYEAAGRGFILARVAGGYRFQSHPDLAPYVERFVLDRAGLKERLGEGLFIPDALTWYITIPSFLVFFVFWAFVAIWNEKSEKFVVF